jgi:CheY-like chemotaxis protein
MKVLFIDDDDLQREATAEALRENGAEVVAVKTPTEALAKLREGFRPNVYLVDLQLQNHGAAIYGDTFMDRLTVKGDCMLAAPAMLPVVYLTALTDPRIVIPSNATILRKPTEPARIFKALMAEAEESSVVFAKTKK